MADLRGSRTVHYRVERFYPGVDRQKFWDMFVDYEGWTNSDILAGKISILSPGEGHPMGRGAVRTVLSGSLSITEDIIAFQPPAHFVYASRNGAMPVNDFLGELFLVSRPDGLALTYLASFNPKVRGTGWLFRLLFRRAHVSVFRALGEAYAARHGAPGTGRAERA